MRRVNLRAASARIWCRLVYRSAGFCAAVLTVAPGVLGSHEPAVDPDDTACQSAQDALAAYWHLPPNVSSQPRWQCDLRPLRNTNDYIVIVLQTNDAHEASVGPYGGWYAVMRRDNSVYFLTNYGLEGGHLIPVPKPAPGTPYAVSPSGVSVKDELVLGPGEALLVADCRKEGDPYCGLELRSLVVVHTIKGLPNDVNVLLGRQKEGPDGIADVGEPFNRTDVVDRRLPMRRFIVAGVSSTSVLVAYEQGGRGYSMQARGYVLEHAGWRQVGAWTIGERPYTVIGLVGLVFPQFYGVTTVDGRSLKEMMHIQNTRPIRREGPLRADNVSDDEVREMQAVMAQVLPGSILNISGVVSGCACEDGLSCSSQVWIVAHRPERTKGLQLSKIDGHWAIGPVQQWWLDFENLAATRNRFSSHAAFYAAQSILYDQFPAACEKRPTDSTATSSARK
jgi:hypothetical protein